MRLGLLLTLVLPLAACSSVRDYTLNFTSDAQLNPNQPEPPNTPNTVRVKLLLLRGEEAARQFRTMEWDDLWQRADEALGKQALYEAPTVPTFRDVMPGTRLPVRLPQIPPEVTHVGVLANFNEWIPDQDRVVLECARTSDYEIWLRGYTIQLRPLGAATSGETPATTAQPKQGS